VTPRQLKEVLQKLQKLQEAVEQAQDEMIAKALRHHGKVVRYCCEGSCDIRLLRVFHDTAEFGRVCEQDGFARDCFVVPLEVFDET
jgi:hypothetical protein